MALPRWTQRAWGACVTPLVLLPTPQSKRFLLCPIESAEICTAFSILIVDRTVYFMDSESCVSLQIKTTYLLRDNPSWSTLVEFLIEGVWNSWLKELQFWSVGHNSSLKTSRLNGKTTWRRAGTNNGPPLNAARAIKGSVWERSQTETKGQPITPN